MRYENRRPAEGVNVSREHPLRQFAKLLVAATVLVVAIIFVLQLSGAWIAKRIPFTFEQQVMASLDVQFGDSDVHPELQQYLNSLAMRVMQHMSVPEGMNVAVHYSSDDVFNAFATVGGNLLFYKGLLKKMPHENALATVMAHEVAHVLHRDPVAGLGGGVASSIALLALTGNSGTGTAGRLLNNAGVLTGMRFTRSMETAADSAALGAVNGLYGHVNGANGLFELFGDIRDDTGFSVDWLERFASTHPLDTDRILAVDDTARANGWSTSGDITPLPDGFMSWL